MSETKSSERIWQRRECVSAEVEGSLVLLDLETLAYHSLNRTAAVVWELLDVPKSSPELVEALCQRYDITPEKCDASVELLLREFTASNLVQPLQP